MGIKKLTPLLREFAPLSIKPVTDFGALLNGRMCLIDVAIYMHQFAFGYNNLSLDMPLVEFIGHRMIAMSRAIESLGGHPLMIFDGPSPDAKAKLQDRRKADRLKKYAEVVTKINRLNDLKSGACKGLTDIEWFHEVAELENEVSSLSRINEHGVRVPHDFPSRDMFPFLKSMFGASAIRWMVGESEAERECALISHFWNFEGTRRPIIFSQDMDALCFGGALVLREVTLTDLQIGVTSKTTAFTVKLSRALKQLDISMETFVNMCVLMGSDFTETTLPRIGMKTALRAMQTHETIEKYLHGGPIHDAKRFDYKTALAIFKLPQTYTMPWCVSYYKDYYTGALK